MTMLKWWPLAICFVLLIMALPFRSLWHWHVKAAPSLATLHNRYFEIVAHRGYSAIYPENTMPAFEAGAHLKADRIELDVHLSADGKVVVIHDAALARTTNGTGYVGEKTWAELQQLDAGSWKDSSFADTKIPSLEQVLREIAPKVPLLIELKNDRRNLPYTGLAKKVLELIVQYDAQTQCTLQSFESKYLAEIAALSPNTPLMRLIEWDAAPLPLYADVSLKFGQLPLNPAWKALNMHYAWLTPDRVESLKKQGIYTYPYTINTEADMRRAVNMGVAGIITNEIRLAVEVRRSVVGLRPTTL